MLFPMRAYSMAGGWPQEQGTNLFEQIVADACQNSDLPTVQDSHALLGGYIRQEPRPLFL